MNFEKSTIVFDTEVNSFHVTTRFSLDKETRMLTGTRIIDRVKYDICSRLKEYTIEELDAKSEIMSNLLDDDFRLFSTPKETKEDK